MTKPTGRPVGRPPLADPRTVRIDVPLTESERSLIGAAAEAAGQRPASWLREAGLRAARRAVKS